MLKLHKKPEIGSKSDTQSDNISSPDVKLILKQLNLLKFEQSKLINLVNKQIAKLDAFEQKFTEVFSQLATIKDDNILLHNNLNSLTARLEAIELNRSTPDEDSFSDFVDRQARSKNVILFNVPDAPDDSNNSDSSTVDLIFTKLALDIKPITIQRLGKFDGKIRPLKISLASASDVFKTLGSSRKLKSDQIFNAVRITSDKTPKQRLYFQNLRKELDKRRSDVSKLNTLTPLLCTSGLDIIAFTETWLYPSISTSELNFSNYTVFRCDRSSLNSSSGRGGGVLIAVKSTLICKVLNVSVKSVEHVFVLINLGPNILILGCVYIPPLSPITFYEQFFKAVNELFISNSRAKFVLLGDFNLPSLNWSLYSLPIICNSPIDSYFISMLSQFNFNQFNLLRNNNNVTLDLVLSNIHLSVSNEPDPLLPIDKHHPALNITLKYEQFSILSTTYDIIYDFKNCDYVKIVKYIGDSLNIFNPISSDVNGAVDRLYMVLHDSINIFVPKRRIYNNTYPIWYSNSLKSLLKEKKICHLVYKQYSNISDYITFSNLRAQCKRLAKSDYKNYINTVQHSIKNNPKYFWSFIKNVTNNNALPKSLSLDTTVVDNGTDIVNVFAKYFSDSYSNIQHPPNSSSLNINKINLNSDINLNSISFTELDLTHLLQLCICTLNMIALNVDPFLSKMDSASDIFPDSRASDDSCTVLSDIV
ncbi:hypothetical protein QTP88_018251 [Uroleucon formosanum]